MKKLFLVLTLLCMLFAFCACSNSGSSGGEIDLTKMSDEQLANLQSQVQQEISSRPDDHAVMINQALDVLKARWKEEYDQCGKPGVTFRLDVRGVRVIRMKDNMDEKAAGTFGNIKYLIEFLFYDDYYSDRLGYSGHNVGYYDYSGAQNSVIVDRDGNMSISSNLIRIYVGKTYEQDYSGFIESVTDYRDQYNQVIEFSY